MTTLIRKGSHHTQERKLITGGPLNIVKDHYGQDILSAFQNRQTIDGREVILITRVIFGEVWTHAEPAFPADKEGQYAMGGTWLVDGNGNHPDFRRPVPFHDRQMWLEAHGPEREEWMKEHLKEVKP